MRKRKTILTNCFRRFICFLIILLLCTRNIQSSPYLVKPLPDQLVEVSNHFKFDIPISNFRTTEEYDTMEISISSSPTFLHTKVKEREFIGSLFSDTWGPRAWSSCISESGKYALLADDEGKFRVFNMTFMDYPIFISDIKVKEGYRGMGLVRIRGEYIYYGGYMTDRTHIFSIDEDTLVVSEQLGSFVLEERKYDFFVSVDNKYIYSAAKEGLFVIHDISDKSNPIEISSLYTSRISHGLKVFAINKNKNICLFLTKLDFYIYDISDPSHPIEESNFPILDDDIMVNFIVDEKKTNENLTLIYLLTTKGLRILEHDWRNKTFSILSRLDFTPIFSYDQFTSMDRLYNNYLIISESGKGFDIIDIGNPNSPYIVARNVLENKLSTVREVVVFKDTYLLVSCETKGWKIFEINSDSDELLKDSRVLSKYLYQSRIVRIYFDEFSKDIFLIDQFGGFRGYLFDPEKNEFFIEQGGVFSTDTWVTFGFVICFLEIKNQYLFYGSTVFSIMDLRDYKNKKPKVIGKFEKWRDGKWGSEKDAFVGFVYHDDIGYLLSYNGLIILDLSDENIYQPVEIGGYDIKISTSKVAKKIYYDEENENHEDLLFVIHKGWVEENYINTLYIFDISNHSNPTLLSNYTEVFDQTKFAEIPNYKYYMFMDLIVKENYVYISKDDPEMGLIVVDISNPSNPFLHKSYEIFSTNRLVSYPGYTLSTEKYKDIIYISFYPEHGHAVFDFSNSNSNSNNNNNNEEPEIKMICDDAFDCDELMAIEIIQNNLLFGTVFHGIKNYRFGSLELSGTPVDSKDCGDYVISVDCEENNYQKSSFSFNLGVRKDGEECSVPIIYCFGIESTLIDSVCNTHGECVGADRCVCDTNYFGERCEIHKCYDVLSNYSNTVCSGHGECMDYNKCECDDNYSSYSCSISSCNNISSISSNVCNSNGICKEYDVCDCDSGYYDEFCSITECFGILSNYTSDVCNSNGKCVDFNKCECNDPYFGKECKDSDNKCSEEGYYGKFCNITTCYGIFSNDTNNINLCGGNGECKEKDKCLCDDHYYGKKCEVTSCFEILTNSTATTETDDDDDEKRICCGRGVCEDYNSCKCNSYFLEDMEEVIDESTCCCKNDNYFGDFCNVTTCYGIENWKENEVCSTHGVCEDFNSCRCFSNSNYTGEKCDQKIIQCFGSVRCNNHGDCEHEDNKCECDDGYFGTQCENWKCFDILSNSYNNENDKKICNGRGECIGPDTCDCFFKGNKFNEENCGCKDNNHYFGYHCDITTCFGVFSNDTNKDSNLCSGNGECEGYNTCKCYILEDQNVENYYDNCTIMSKKINSNSNSNSTGNGNNSGFSLFSNPILLGIGGFIILVILICCCCCVMFCVVGIIFIIFVLVIGGTGGGGSLLICLKGRKGKGTRYKHLQEENNPGIELRSIDNSEGSLEFAEKEIVDAVIL